MWCTRTVSTGGGAIYTASVISYTWSSSGHAAGAQVTEAWSAILCAAVLGGRRCQVQRHATLAALSCSARVGRCDAPPALSAQALLLTFATQRTCRCACALGQPCAAPARLVSGDRHRSEPSARARADQPLRKEASSNECIDTRSMSIMMKEC